MAWTELGNVYFLKNKLSDAEDAYKKALEQNPEFPLAMLNLGRLYLIQMNGVRAIEILSKSVAKMLLRAIVVYRKNNLLHQVK